LDIRAIIRELLFGHDCVIIPGFGGFIGNFSPARIDKATGMFHPPVKQISFNRNLNHNDGLLISKISAVTGLNYGDSRRLVEEFVMLITGKLSRGEKVVFDHIGCFVNNRENNVQFEPEANINYFAGSFGLESFRCLPLQGYDVRKRVVRHIDKEPSMNQHTARNLWRAAVIVPLLALLVAIPLKTDLFKAKVEATSMNPLVTAEFESNRKAVDAEVVTLPAPVAGPVEETPAPAPGPAAVTKGQYSIITGSFKSEQNALEHVDLLRAAGFTPEIRQASNGFYRVTAASCRDLETAISTRDSITGKFPGAWITRL
jgi:nucleoid DNA-binding protein